MMGANVVIGGFWGDEGKGVISAWEAFRTGSLGVFRGCGGANPEHGMFIDDHYIKVNQLPLGFILQECMIGIGPGTAVDPAKLLHEVKRFHLTPEKVRVDRRCPIITVENIASEKANANMQAIGSTFSGTGIAMAHAALRIASIAEDVKELRPYLDDVPALVNDLAKRGKVNLEGTQGTFLSRYHGEYPNVTSVDVTTSSVVAGTGLNFRDVEDVIVAVKSLPTREGSGAMGDVEEFTSEEMEELGIVEYSSIVDLKSGEHQIRRKAKGIDYTFLNRVIMLNGANKLALTFAEQYDPQVRGVTRWSELTRKVRELIDKIESMTNVEVTLVNTGKEFDCLASKRDDLPPVTEAMRTRLRAYIE
ncbi:MAG TPA: adenylosuccinate synthetase [Anaerolineaceae bacterium]|jgi:adenylosuccinate synthase|nr:adenylosuccinate synthetase [Anaerolineaceae bacterium]